MSEKKCAICLEYMTEEDPTVIGMSGYSTPVCACESCVEKLDRALKSTDYDEIVSNMDSVYEVMKKKNNDHPLVVDIVSEMLNRAAKRASAIKEGTYDFSLDEEENAEGEGFDEVPEELLETEEDKELDQMEKEQNEKVDKVMNIVSYVAFGACVLGILYFLFFIL